MHVLLLFCVVQDNSLVKECLPLIINRNKKYLCSNEKLDVKPICLNIL